MRKYIQMNPNQSFALDDMFYRECSYHPPLTFQYEIIFLLTSILQISLFKLTIKSILNTYSLLLTIYLHTKKRREP